MVALHKSDRATGIQANFALDAPDLCGPEVTARLQVDTYVPRVGRLVRAGAEHNGCDDILSETLAGIQAFVGDA